MEYSFAADSTKLGTLYTTLTEQIGNVDTALTNIFNAYKDLGNYWKGTNYDNFKSQVDAKEDEIKKCISVFTAFADLVNDAKTDESKLQSAILSAVGAGGGGGTRYATTR